MEQREDMWRSALQEQFDHFEAETERDLWPAIEEQLDTRRVPFYLWRSTWLVAASIAVLMGLIWMLGLPTRQDQQPMAQTEEPVAPVQPDAPILQQDSPRPDMADASLLPASPEPEVIEKLERQRFEDSQRQQQTNTPREMIVESSLPADRIIRQPGPTNPLSPHNILHHIDQPVPREQIATQAPVPTAAEAVPTQPVEAVVATTPKPQPTQAPAATQGQRRSLDLNNLSLSDAVTFASSELGKLVKTPLEVYTEETEDHEVRTYQLDLFNLRITRKTHKQTN